MIVGYLAVCQRKIHVDHLYRGNSSSIYWYTGGVNWRALLATVGVVPLMQGFVAAVNTSVHVSEGATELYYMNYVYGFCASGAAFALLHRVFPSQRLDGYVNDSMTPEEAMSTAREKWDNTQYDSSAMLEPEDKDQNKAHNVNVGAEEA